MGSGKLEVGSGKLEVGSWKWEVMSCVMGVHLRWNGGKWGRGVVKTPISVL